MVDGTEDTLGSTVLGRGVGARHAELNTAGEEEGAGGGVIKLAAIVTLDIANGGGKLSFNIGEKLGQGGKGVGFEAKLESPNIVRAIIKNDKIIFETRNANDRRCPQVTMY